MESLSNLGLHSSLTETPDSGERARYRLPNNTLKRHSHARVRQIFAALKRMVLGLFGLKKGIIYTLVWFSRQPRERMNVVIVLIPNE